MFMIIVMDIKLLWVGESGAKFGIRKEPFWLGKQTLPDLMINVAERVSGSGLQHNSLNGSMDDMAWYGMPCFPIMNHLNEVQKRVQ